MRFEHRLFSRAEGRLSRVVLTQENQIFGGRLQAHGSRPGQKRDLPEKQHRWPAGETRENAHAAIGR